MSITSDFLFAQPSFAEGAARMLDFGNSLEEYNGALSGDQADSIALKMDMRAVGLDFNAAAKAVTDEQGPEQG